MKYFVIIVICLLSYSCKKEIEQENTKQENTKQENTKQETAVEIEKDFALIPVIWIVTPEDFEAEMLALMDLADLAEIGDRVEIRVVESGFEFTLIAGGGVPYDPTPSELLDCGGSGASFINCVYSWMQVNPDCCVVITNGDAGLTANSAC